MYVKLCLGAPLRWLTLWQLLICQLSRFLQCPFVLLLYGTEISTTLQFLQFTSYIHFYTHSHSKVHNQRVVHMQGVEYWNADWRSRTIKQKRKNKYINIASENPMLMFWPTYTTFSCVVAEGINNLCNSLSCSQVADSLPGSISENSPWRRWSEFTVTFSQTQLRSSRHIPMIASSSFAICSSTSWHRHHESPKLRLTLIMLIFSGCFCI